MAERAPERINNTIFSVSSSSASGGLACAAPQLTAHAKTPLTYQNKLGIDMVIAYYSAGITDKEKREGRASDAAAGKASFANRNYLQCARMGKISFADEAKTGSSIFDAQADRHFLKMVLIV